MTLKQQYLTSNNCYKAGRKMKPIGIMLHSTGANNPNLSRYVGDPGQAWNVPKPDGREVCVHAFIGKAENGKVETRQTLPWDMQGWHSGDKANDGYIGIEICEDDLTDQAYFSFAYWEAFELCGMLCNQYGIKPEIPTLICHCEGYKLGLASNHADVMHWFPLMGKTMDIFRKNVLSEMALNTEVTPTDALLARMDQLGIARDDSVWRRALTDGGGEMPMAYVMAMSARLLEARPNQTMTARELRNMFSIMMG